MRRSTALAFRHNRKMKEIRVQLTEQFKCLDQQCELRVQLLQDLQDFFRKKAEVEMDYSRNLEKLAERFLTKTRSTKDQQFKKEQNVLSPVNCWNILLSQVKRESRDHATLSDIYLNNIIPRFGQVSEDSGRLFKKSKEVGVQLQEDLMKVLNELYSVSEGRRGGHGGRGDVSLSRAAVHSSRPTRLPPPPQIPAFLIQE
ncbi:SLIT-ROBO Rho GTPase-activating protein 2B-like [Rhinatrema bivittatum]|uniref:SLIT-ROBO Rho GTPase-activating protein 2B-like n=1 Tax=Rhinatrema bivittatum TaxID=194408 RepID=UPI00112AE8B0|nr:SLIT-ROBO Rho GTPase-activating protein 2B-like [Rhinatrema bivittatum]